MSKIKYYKVTDGSQCSFGVSRLVSIYYTIGQWTMPEVGKLFCFDSLTNAVALWATGCRIFECEVKNPQHYDGKILANPKPEYIREFWKRFDNQSKLVTFRLVDTPTGTVLCDSIKLIKEIK